MRQIFFLFLTLHLQAQKKPDAVGLSRGEKYARYFLNQTGINSTARFVAGKACDVAGCLVKSPAHAVQMMFLVASVASIEGMKQLSEISKIKNQKISMEDRISMAEKSSGAVLESTEFWSGIGSMLGANKVFSPILKGFAALLKDTSTRLMTQKLLTNMSANLVGLVSFEFGSELVKRSIDMITDKNDNLAAQKLGARFWQILTQKEPITEADKRIRDQIFSNMFAILSEEQLRESLWSFVTRNRIQTGEFATGVALSTVGATIGSEVAQCFPHPLAKVAVPVVAMITGVAVGTASVYVPKDIKQGITQDLQSARMKSADMQAQTALLDGSAQVDRYSKLVKQWKSVGRSIPEDDWQAKNVKSQIEESLSRLDRAQEKLMEATFDQVHLLNAKLLELTNKIRMAQEFQNKESENQLRGQFNEVYKNYVATRKNLDEKMAYQLTELNQIARQAQSTPLSPRIDRQLQQVEELKKQTTVFMDQLQSTAAWSQINGPKKEVGIMSEEENQMLLEKVYMWGFKREPFVEYMQFN